MAGAAALERAARSTGARRDVSERSTPRRLDVVGSRSRPRPTSRHPHRGRAPWVVSAGLLLGSALTVVAAHAELAQGQVRLARLQQRVATDLRTHRTLEMQIAELDAPAHIVAAAQQQGLVAPAQVGDLPQADLSSPQGAAPRGQTVAATPAATRSTVPSR